MVHTHSPSLDTVAKLAVFEIRNLPRADNIDSHQDCIYGLDYDYDYNDRNANLRRWHNIYEFYNLLHHLWMLRLQQAANLKNYDHDHDHDHNLSWITYMFLVSNPHNMSSMFLVSNPDNMSYKFLVSNPHNMSSMFLVSNPDNMSYKFLVSNPDNMSYKFLVSNPDNVSYMHDVFSFNHDYHDN